ncbi:MAG: response regulator [Anaerolineae bacterium]
MVSESILIIEDEPEVIQLLRVILEPRGFAVLDALGGEKALDILQQNTPAVILLDLAMPHVNGLDLLAAIETMPHLADTRIIVITARPQMAAQIEKNERIAAIFFKPVRPVQIIHFLESMLA